MKKPKLINRIYDAVEEVPYFRASQIGFMLGTTGPTVTSTCLKYGTTFDEIRNARIRKLHDHWIMSGKQKETA